jgi:hypothetical protein
LRKAGCGLQRCAWRPPAAGEEGIRFVTEENTPTAFAGSTCHQRPPCRRTLTRAGLCGSLPKLTITEACRVRKSDVLLQMSACHTPLSGGREEPVSRQRSRMTKMLTPYKRAGPRYQSAWTLPDRAWPVQLARPPWSPRDMVPRLTKPRSTMGFGGSLAPPDFPSAVAS